MVGYLHPVFMTFPDTGQSSPLCFVLYEERQLIYNVYEMTACHSAVVNLAGKVI